MQTSAGTVHVSSVSVHSYVLWWFECRQPCPLAGFHALWLLPLPASFSAGLLGSWYRGRDLIDIPSLRAKCSDPLAFCIMSDWVSVFVLICCRRKLSWWRLSMSSIIQQNAKRDPLSSWRDIKSSQLTRHWLATSKGTVPKLPEYFAGRKLLLIQRFVLGLVFVSLLVLCRVLPVPHRGEGCM